MARGDLRVYVKDAPSIEVRNSKDRYLNELSYTCSDSAISRLNKLANANRKRSHLYPCLFSLHYLFDWRTKKQVHLIHFQKITDGKGY